MKEILVPAALIFLLVCGIALVIGWDQGDAAKKRFMATVGRGVMALLALIVVPVLAISAASAL